MNRLYRSSSSRLSLCSTQFNNVFVQSATVTQQYRYKSCGLVGLPNVGKSTLFNALTNTQLAQASNYPFTTIQPNKSFVAINDELLNKLADVVHSKKIITSQIEFIDIAGLVRNASSGAGLGNQFLNNIRSVDCIVHMIRCYDNMDIIHVDNSIDPIRDLHTIETELLLSDLQVIEKKLYKSSMKSNHQNTSHVNKLLQQCNDILNSGNWIYDYMASMTTEQQQWIKSFNFITSKPIIYVCNVDDHSAANGNKYSDAVKQYINDVYNNIADKQTPNNHKPGELVYQPQYRSVLHIAAALEADACETFQDDIQSRTDYLHENNIKINGLDQIVNATSKLLKQHKFYTIGPDQCVSWYIPYNSTALYAANKIHSDIAAGFISGEIIQPSDYIQYNGESGCKAAGRMNIVGKDYIMQDNDIVHFKFNKTKKLN